MTQVKVIVRQETLLYWATLLLMLTGSLIPHWRLWGVNVWAFYPAPVIATVFAVACLLPFVIPGARDRKSHVSEQPSKQWPMLGAVILIAFSAAFILGRAQTHFTGDGYQLLSMLQDTGYPFKAWDKGTGWVIEAVMGITESSLTTYQIVSIGAGLLSLVAVLVASRYLFTTALARALFTIGVMNSGGALLFFGYVENYALLCLFVVLFGIGGMLHASSKINRWWLVFPAVGAMLSHVFGVVTIPALLYLLARDSKPAVELGRRPRRTRGLIGLIALIIAGAAGCVVWANSIFLKTALVPPTTLRFTPDGYTLLSLAHLVDYVNLLFLLAPGLAVAGAALLLKKSSSETTNTERTFLAIIAVSGLAIAFVIDPKLGMPRDWDLFGFAGFLLALALFRPLCAALDGDRGWLRPTLLAVVLGVIALVPRVTATRSESLAINRIESYMKLDPLRHRATYRVLWDYYASTNQGAKARETAARLEEEYPERDIVLQAVRLGVAGRTNDAFILLRKALRLAPNWPDVYFNIGYAFLQVDQVDSAMTYLKLADALNPNNADTYNAMGIAWLKRADQNRAREYFERAVALNPGYASALVSIADIGIRTGDLDLTRTTLKRLGALDSGGIEGAMALSRKLAKQHQPELAARALEIAVKHGLSNEAAQKHLQDYPGIRPYFNRNQ